MLSNRNQADTDTRIAVETLRYFQKNDQESFKEFRKDLQGIPLWERFEKEYGS